MPVLGICYGMQLGAQILGGQVKPAKAREYGRAKLQIVADRSVSCTDLPDETTVWMSHGDRSTSCRRISCRWRRRPPAPTPPRRHKTRPFYGVQFHPEVTHTPRGEKIFQNFLYEICKCSGDWTMGNFIEQTITARPRAGRQGRR